MIKAKQRRTRTLTSQLNASLAALSVFAGGKAKHLQGPFAVAMPQKDNDGNFELHGVDKAAHRRAFTAEFGKNGSDGFAGWSEGVATDSAVAGNALRLTTTHTHTYTCTHTCTHFHTCSPNLYTYSESTKHG